jgi:hypothetical protein
MAPETFVPTIGCSCFFGDIPIKIVAGYSTEFGKGKAFLCQRTVPSTKQEYNTKSLVWEDVPCEKIEESIIWEKDLSGTAAKAK